MNGSLGRDRVWNDHIWSEIDKAVREEVGRVRVAQKVFPSTVVNNVLPVSTNRVVPVPENPPAERPTDEPEDPGIDQFLPFFEISKDFVLTPAQVDGEENMHLAPSLAKLAASAIANAEDRILFLGERGIPEKVTVTNKAAIPPGFVAEAGNFTTVPEPPSDILTAVAAGIAELNKDNQPGPYALFVSPERYAKTFAPTSRGFLLTPGDQVNHVVTGGFYIVNSLADPDYLYTGILVSLGGEPAKIILGTEAITAFSHIDEKSNYNFRVFERIQMVVRDGRAFQTLEFSKEEQAGERAGERAGKRAGKRAGEPPQEK